MEPMDEDEDDRQPHKLCCIICKSPESQFDKNLSFVKRGIEKLIDYSVLVSDERLKDELLSRKSRNIQVRIHRDCQRGVYNTMKKSAGTLRMQEEAEAGLPKPTTTRSRFQSFDWTTQCMFCETQCTTDERHPDRQHWRKVQVLSMRENLLSICDSRSDDCAQRLKRRLLTCTDLVAAEARYHCDCRMGFKRTQEDTNSTPGRPPDHDKNIYFEAACSWLESQTEIQTVSEVYEHMLEIAGSEENVYSAKWLKTKLKERYGDHVSFTEEEGKHSKICFSNMIDYLITEKWYHERKTGKQDEAKRIISMAAKLISDDIRACNFDTESYPTIDQMRDAEKSLEWVPPKLRLLLQSFCKSATKRSSIGQAIVTASRPRSCIAPILFGLAVDVDHVFGSRWLIDQLNRLGFSSSMDEVIRYKQSVMMNDNYDGDRTELVGSFTQWSADNVDHNVRTLDGKGSLHAMGIISSTTNKFGPSCLEMRPIKRNKLSKVADIVEGQGIPIRSFVPQSSVT